MSLKLQQHECCCLEFGFLLDGALAELFPLCLLISIHPARRAGHSMSMGSRSSSGAKGAVSRRPKADLGMSLNGMKEFLVVRVYGYP